MDMTNLDGEIFTLQGDMLMFYTGEEWYANSDYSIYAMLSYNGMEIYEVFVASIHVTAPIDACESSTIVVENLNEEYTNIEFVIGESDEIFAVWPYIYVSDETTAGSCGTYTVHTEVYRGDEQLATTAAFLTEGEQGVSLWTEDASLAGTYYVHLHVYLDDYEFVSAHVDNFMTFSIVNGEDECAYAYLTVDEYWHTYEYPFLTYTFG